MSESSNNLCVELGFIEKIEPWKLRSKYFASKIGGWPSWLGLESLPTEADLLCQKCKKPLIFLCQVYAPIATLEHCFHRTVFVFICRDGKCSAENDSSNLKIFRCQLHRENKYYSYDPAKEEEKDSDKPSASDFVKICRVCGSFGPKVCGSCKLVTYCSRDHQAADWKAGHKMECKNKELKCGASEASKTILFPEYEIDLEPEEIEGEGERTENEVMADYEKLLKKGQNPETDFEEKDLLKSAAKETDKQFAKFRTRIDFYPDQIIRYNRGGEPLFVSSDHKPKEIAPCEGCGEERIFEFQVMPQLLVHLKVDNPGRSIDWGTILVYTCASSCSQEGNLYKEAVAYKQDYSPSTDFLKTNVN